MTVVGQPRQRSLHQTPKRIINVVGAVIVKDGKILCAQRGEGQIACRMLGIPWKKNRTS